MLTISCYLFTKKKNRKMWLSNVSCIYIIPNMSWNFGTKIAAMMCLFVKKLFSSFQILSFCIYQLSDSACFSVVNMDKSLVYIYLTVTEKFYLALFRLACYLQVNTSKSMRSHKYHSILYLGYVWDHFGI